MMSNTEKSHTKKTIYNQLNDILFGNKDAIDNLFNHITNAFPDYKEVDSAFCPSMYVAAPQSTSVTTSMGHIAANWIEIDSINDMRIIAGQPPKDEIIDRFWIGMCENNVNNIVDLRMPSEYEYKDYNISKYWPMENGPSIILDKCSINHKNSSLINYNGLDIVKNEYIVFNKKTELNHLITRYEYRSWPDAERISILNVYILCKWLHEIQFKNNVLNKVGNLYLHCSGGVGRTGVIAISYLLYYQAIKGLINNSNVIDKIMSTIKQSRECRGRLLIARPAQLDMVLSFMKFIMPTV